ncbi:hypothetical protein BS47DRAFT_1393897 [Hydnum rufescens UP504]|uniref:Uncharacterized protein n=1 Tax=Hydnum rufescens UP504 TaxID=1448309 RepID=A0A9P6AVD7_9AGAM|nr:hypothetical protein BS47DRAFT_1393897 [Hydnum rufescens UP504]
MANRTLPQCRLVWDRKLGGKKQRNRLGMYPIAKFNTTLSAWRTIPTTVMLQIQRYSRTHIAQSDHRTAVVYSIRLILPAFSRLFHLHLHPNHEIVHPDAQVDYFHLEPDGTSVLSYSGLLITDAVVAFQYEVVHNDHTLQRLREGIAGGLNRGFNRLSGSLGWATIIIHHQGDIQRGVKPSFEGSFSVDGVVHHIVTLENYVRSKHIRDPDADPESADGSLVVFRDFDVMTMCVHDRLEYGRDALRHPVLRTGAGLDTTRTTTGWYNPVWLSKSPFVDMHLGMSMKRNNVTDNLSSNFINAIGKSDGCSKSQKIPPTVRTLPITGVSDATTQILNNLNIASALYKSTFNIGLEIIELNIQSPTCPANADPRNAWNVGCDTNITLYVRCPAGMEIGVAWLGTVYAPFPSATLSTHLFAMTSDVKLKPPLPDHRSFLEQLSLRQPGQSKPASLFKILLHRGTNYANRWWALAHEIGHNLRALVSTTLWLLKKLFSSISPQHDVRPLTVPLLLEVNIVSSAPQIVLSAIYAAQLWDQLQRTSKFPHVACISGAANAFSQWTLGNVYTSMLFMNTSCLLDASVSRSVIPLQTCGNGTWRGL